MPFNVGFLSQCGLYPRPVRVPCQLSETFFCRVLTTDFGIGFKNASGAMRVFCPRPMSSGGIKNLAIQKWDDQLLQKSHELELRLKEIVLIKGTAEASALVPLIKVPIRSGVDLPDVKRR